MKQMGKKGTGFIILPTFLIIVIIFTVAWAINGTIQKKQLCEDYGYDDWEDSWGFSNNNFICYSMIPEGCVIDCHKRTSGEITSEGFKNWKEKKK